MAHHTITVCDVCHDTINQPLSVRTYVHLQIGVTVSNSSASERIDAHPDCVTDEVIDGLLENARRSIKSLLAAQRGEVGDRV